MFCSKYGSCSFLRLVHKTAILLAISAGIGLHEKNSFLYAVEQDNDAVPPDSIGKQEDQIPINLQPPIQIGSSSAAGDGGTIFVELIGANNQRLTLEVSQNSWETKEGDIPHDTLFLNVANPWIAEDTREGRLPKSDEEVVEVMRLLSLAAKANNLESDSTAKDVLRRLEQKPSHAIRNPLKGIEPKWYPGYEKKKRKRNSIAKQFEVRESRFLGCFPTRAHALLESSQGEPLSEEEIRRRARGIIANFDDPIDLIAAVCKAFGIRSDDGWRHLDDSDLVLFDVMKEVDTDHLLSSLSRVEKNREALLGASRVLFDPSINYVDRLDETEWKQWVPRLASLVLSNAANTNKNFVVEAISQNEMPEATLLLRSIAEGSSRLKADSTASDQNEISLREMAYLTLALRNDHSIKSAVKNRLETTMHLLDRAALEICMALLGEPNYLRKSHFNLRSRRIGLAALKAIEKYGGKYGIDVLIYSALRRPSLVQQEAAILLQRLSGQRWLPDENVQHSRSHASDAANWWKESKQVFQGKANQ